MGVLALISLQLKELCENERGQIGTSISHMGRRGIAWGRDVNTGYIGGVYLVAPYRGF